jgi:hypothetical protein
MNVTINPELKFDVHVTVHHYFIYLFYKYKY